MAIWMIRHTWRLMRIMTSSHRMGGNRMGWGLRETRWRLFQLLRTRDTKTWGTWVNLATLKQIMNACQLSRTTSEQSLESWRLMWETQLWTTHRLTRDHLRQVNQPCSSCSRWWHPAKVAMWDDLPRVRIRPLRWEEAPSTHSMSHLTRSPSSFLQPQTSSIRGSKWHL